MAEQREWKNGKPGKSECQKRKSLLEIQYILKHADADHPVTIGDIQDHLGKYKKNDGSIALPPFSYYKSSKVITLDQFRLLWLT